MQKREDSMINMAMKMTIERDISSNTIMSSSLTQMTYSVCSSEAGLACILTMEDFIIEDINDNLHNITSREEINHLAILALH